MECDQSHIRADVEKDVVRAKMRKHRSQVIGLPAMLANPEIFNDITEIKSHTTLLEVGQGDNVGKAPLCDLPCSMPPQTRSDRLDRLLVFQHILRCLGSYFATVEADQPSGQIHRDAGKALRARTLLFARSSC
jgi:hypothetical protein